MDESHAVTTTVLAVVASIASSRASYFITKSQLLTALEESQWAYYQAKSIKQDLFLTQEKSFQVDLAGETTPEQKNLLNLASRISRRISHAMSKEKAEIKNKAENVNKQNRSAVATETNFP